MHKGKQCVLNAKTKSKPKSKPKKKPAKKRMQLKS